MSYKHGHNRRGRRSPEYLTWVSMRQRCNNPNTCYYHRYGGRGIGVCKRWDKFDNFLSDMGARPSSKHSIHRKNNDGNYTPSNCEWATPETQALFRAQYKIKTTVKYRGVNKLPSGRYAARIQNCHIAVFDTQKEAARAYNKQAKFLYGKDAVLNDV